MPDRFRKLFRRALGISPTQYADALRLEYSRTLIRGGEYIAGALYNAGYGSSSRLFTKKSARLLGMTPETYKRKGRAQMIRYHLTHTPLGYVLIAATDKGLCSIRLGDSKEELEMQFRAEFEHASLHEGDEGIVGWVAAIADYLQGLSPLPELPLDIQGTAFQARVWDALRKISYGNTVTYSDVAKTIRQPRAVRAVARACATNPVALAIPCHRVVPKSGGIGGYEWGPERKQKLLAMEAR